VRAYSGRVDTVIDGLAASAATYLSMAGRTVSMIEGGMYMIHNSWTLAYGNKSELRKTADLLDKIDLTIRTDYARKSGATDDQLQEWMDAETWWTADEALAAKFVDRVITPDDGTDDGATAAARWDLSAYDRAPKITARALPDDAADVAAKAERIQRLNRGRLAALASYHRALLR
jgi:ATP-dependent Clp protease protease subunit